MDSSSSVPFHVKLLRLLPPSVHPYLGGVIAYLKPTFSNLAGLTLGRLINGEADHLSSSREMASPTKKRMVEDFDDKFEFAEELFEGYETAKDSEDEDIENSKYFAEEKKLSLPNPKREPVKDRSYYKRVLPKEMHIFLDTSPKKDCRIWLWKNETGKKARKMIQERCFLPKLIPVLNLPEETANLDVQVCLEGQEVDPKIG